MRNWRGRHTGRFAVAVVALVAIAAACGDDTDSAASPGVPLVVASTGIWADVVDNVVCSYLARVESVMPSGANPHAYEPSLSDRDLLERADLVVVNGLGLEAGLEDTIEEVETGGVAVLRATEGIDTIDASETAGAHGDGEDAEDGHEESDPPSGDATHGDVHEGDDPHVWFDPQRVIDAIPDLVAALEQAGVDAAALADCADAYVAELVELDTEIEAIVAELPADDRLLVTNHDSLGYLADRYGFTVVGTVIPAADALAETNPAALTELAKTAADAGVAAVFSETQSSDDDVRALGDEIGVPVVELEVGSLGEPGTPTDSYPGLVRTTAETIVAALGQPAE